MAQNYSELRKDNVRDAIYEDVANNLEVLRTSWAGNAFPENPKVGQACYRIDEDNLYFWDGTTWSQKGGGGIDMNTGDKLYDWVGTLAEYKEQDIENQHPEYLCFITDDNVETKQVVTLPVGFIGQTVVPIDESLDLQKYANGQLIFADKFPELVNKLKKSPNLLVDEATWQAGKNLSVFGQCGKFVLDEVAGTIRLPLIINAQGLADLSVMGSIKNESLPNPYSSSRMIGLNSPNGEASLQSGIDYSILNVSPTYQDGAPVQQEAILYPYFIQVANEVDERLPAIREYTLNNPHFFGESKYSENAPYNASWLASNGQYNAQSLYPDMYTQLNSVELNGSLNVGDTIEIDGKTYVKRGLPVVLSTGTLTDYDFVVNQNDQTFRLPLLNGEENIPDYEHKINNVITGTINSTGQTYTAPKSGLFYQQVNIAGGNAVAVTVNGIVVQNLYEGTNVIGYTSGFLTEVRKGDIIKLFVGYGSGTGTVEECYFAPYKGNGTLYYYVGDVVQDASLINAAAVLNEIEELKQGEAKLKSMIRLVTELPETPEEGVLYCIAEG